MSSREFTAILFALGLLLSINYAMGAEDRLAQLPTRLVQGDIDQQIAQQATEAEMGINFSGSMLNAPNPEIAAGYPTNINNAHKSGYPANDASMGAVYFTDTISEYDAYLSTPGSKYDLGSITCYSGSSVAGKQYVGHIAFYPDNFQMPENRLIYPESESVPVVILNYPISQFNAVLSLIQSGKAYLMFSKDNPHNSWVAIGTKGTA